MSFLNRLHIYIERIPVSPKMSDIVVKTMAQDSPYLRLPRSKSARDGSASGPLFILYRSSLAERITEIFTKML